MSRAMVAAAPHRVTLLQWVGAHLFSTWSSSVATLAIFYFAWITIPLLIDWAFVRAVWSPQSASLCRESGQGACWAFVADKYRFILFGTFPADQHWRPALVIAVLIALYALSTLRGVRGFRLVTLWFAGLAAIGVLMWGGLFGLIYVENERWGGLTLTLLLATFGIALAFPLSILLALGRRSDMPLVRWLCISYIELIRGVPLISVLFMASVMLPLFLPAGVSIDKLLRAQLAMILFAAAYLAEVVRGGLQAIPRQQEEAAQALGLTYWQRIRYVTLPQALRISIPPLVNTFIDDQSFPYRTGLDWIWHRGIFVCSDWLFSILLSDVALQPGPRAAKRARKRRTHSQGKLKLLSGVRFVRVQFTHPKM